MKVLHTKMRFIPINKIKFLNNSFHDPPYINFSHSRNIIKNFQNFHAWLYKKNLLIVLLLKQVSHKTTKNIRQNPIRYVFYILTILNISRKFYYKNILKNCNLEKIHLCLYINLCQNNLIFFMFHNLCFHVLYLILGEIKY